MEGSSSLQKQKSVKREKIPIYVYYQWKSTYVYEQEVELEEALELLHRQPSKEEFATNHIGFKTKISDQVIQFIRLDTTSWYFDVPIYGEFKDNYDWTEEDFNATEPFEKLIMFIEDYFAQEDLFNSLMSYEYDVFLSRTAAIGISWKGHFPTNIYRKKD